MKDELRGGLEGRVGDFFVKAVEILKFSSRFASETVKGVEGLESELRVVPGAPEREKGDKDRRASQV